MKLTDTKIKNAKPRDKQYKLTDGQGMHLLIKPNGSKLWRLEYTFNKKRNTHAIGRYPTISLKDARKKLAAIKELITNGIDPNIHRKTQKESTEKNSFEAVANEWFSQQSQTWSKSHSSRIYRRLEKDVFPWIGSMQIDEIKASTLLTTLRRVESRGAIETAHRIQQNCGQIFRYAIATDRAEQDPSSALKDALQPTKEKHHPSIIEPLKIGTLLRAIDGYEGRLVTKCALKIAPLVFVRPGELRHAEWSEFDYDAKEWRIPAEKMKMKAIHIVPLSDQVLHILSELHSLTGKGKYLFPSVRSSSRSISENTVNGALRRLGYTKDEMTGHGFRSIASTRLNEMGMNRDAIERQLAHAERDEIRAAYSQIPPAKPEA
jgi:integrase